MRVSMLEPKTSRKHRKATGIGAYAFLRAHSVEGLTTAENRGILRQYLQASIYGPVSTGQE